MPVDPKFQPVVGVRYRNRQTDPAPRVATGQVSGKEIALRQKLLVVGIIDLHGCHFAGWGWRTEEEVNGVGAAWVLLVGAIDHEAGFRFNGDPFDGRQHILIDRITMFFGNAQIVIVTCHL